MPKPIDIFKKKTLTSATFYYGNGYVRLETNGDPSLIEIKYRGDFYGYSAKMPQKSQIRMSDSKILIFNSGLGEYPETLFVYKGKFNPSRVRIVGYNKNIIVATIVNDTNDDFWNKGIESKQEWQDAQGTWDYEETEDIDSDVERVPLFAYKHPNKNNISVLNKNTSEHTETLYLKNGSIYNGSYHTESDGSAYTGISYGRDRKLLYRKSKINSKLYATSLSGRVDMYKQYKNVKRNETVKNRIIEAQKRTNTGTIAMKIKQPKEPQSMGKTTSTSGQAGLPNPSGGGYGGGGGA